MQGTNDSGDEEIKESDSPEHKLQNKQNEGERRRIVRANDREFNLQFGYADNYIKTSKYNVFTFLPINLLEQFQRLANFYFLVLMCLQFIPLISSVIWYSTAIPLLFVLLVSAVKDGYDDVQRHKSDNQVNNRVSYIVRNGRLDEEQWMNVKVGDIVRMENEHFIAADLLLLSSSELYGLCYIETAELDGETNLKSRCALPETSGMADIVNDISAFDGEIHCEPPNIRLDTFEGRLVYKGRQVALDNSKILLRGCRLRNTRWCYGLVIFAGRDTKLMMNSGRTTLKRTSLDRFLNVLILGIVLFLFAMCFICMVLTCAWEFVTGHHFSIYLQHESIIPDNNVALSVSIISFLQFFSYIILLNTVVPISLYISVEVLRFCHSLWINFDRKMYYEKTDTPACARTTTLNEELGQVQYIFSDKTGTLTQNIMIFKKCSINGRSYGDLLNERSEVVEIDEMNTQHLDFSWNRWYEPNFRFYDHTLLNDTRRGLEEVQEFWRLLAICHTVMPERKAGNLLEYQAQSPDEAALTSAARNFGFVFKSRTPRTITIEVNGKQEIYEVLHILDFDNVRKRMSVIVRSSANKSDDTHESDLNSSNNRDNNTTIKLYCKGADTMIFERLSSTYSSDLLKTATLQHLDKFASDGLRTLCVAYKLIDPEYCWKWMERQREATLDVTNKAHRLDELYEEIEKDMILLGATAIEDKLQDGVPQTISTLTEANIKIWVLTGDKTETAINIGYSCKLLTEEMREVFIIDGDSEREVEVQMKDIRRRIERANNLPNSVLESSMANTPNGAKNGWSPRSTKSEKNASKTQISTISQTLVENGNKFSSNHQKPAVKTIFGSSHGDLKTDNDCSDDRTLEGFALVINGSSLVHALNKKYDKLFLEIACLCISVICCRVTPLQKAKVVDLVKRHVKAVTLAIGDGANDVSMIKTAHIGVGISGQEGMQAVLASDFSIGQFRYLERLLLVHGRWSYLRMSKFLRYFFYKNFSYTLTHFWYSFFCGYSAQTIYDPFLIACYNMFFTSLPVLAMGVFDQDVNDEYSLRYPKLYIPGQYNLFFNMRIFVYSVIHGGISSIVLFFIPYGAIRHGIDKNGHDANDYTLLSFTIFTALVIVVTGQIMFDTGYWTIFNHLCIWGSLAFYITVVVVLYNFTPIEWATPSVTASYEIGKHAFYMPSFWFALLLICVILLVPVLANRFFWFDTRPSYADRLRVLYKLFPHEKRSRGDGQREGTAFSKPARTAATCRSRRGSLRSGYAFSHSQGFGELIAKGTLFRNLEHFRIPSFKSSDSPKRNSSASKSFSKLNTTKAVPQLSPLIEKNFVDSSLRMPKSTTIPTKIATSDRGISNNVINKNETAGFTVEESFVDICRRKTYIADHSTPHLLTSNTANKHQLLVNLDDDEPPPTNWVFGASGNFEVLELERPPLPGTGSKIGTSALNVEKTSCVPLECITTTSCNDGIRETNVACQPQNKSITHNFISKQRRSSQQALDNKNETEFEFSKKQKDLINHPLSSKTTEENGLISEKHVPKTENNNSRQTAANIYSNNQKNIPKLKSGSRATPSEVEVNAYTPISTLNNMAKDIDTNERLKKSNGGPKNKQQHPPTYLNYLQMRNSNSVITSSTPTTLYGGKAMSKQKSYKKSNRLTNDVLPIEHHPRTSSEANPATIWKRRQSNASSEREFVKGQKLHVPAGLQSKENPSTLLISTPNKSKVLPTTLIIEDDPFPCAGNKPTRFKQPSSVFRTQKVSSNLADAKAISQPSRTTSAKYLNKNMRNERI